MRDFHRKIIAFALFSLFGSVLLFSGCNGSTDPSDVYRDQLLVVDAVTGSVDQIIEVETGGDGQVAVSPDGNTMYLCSGTTGISVVNLSAGSISAELQIPGNWFYSMELAVNDDGSELYAFCSKSGAQNVFYKITTADMTVVDSLDLGEVIPFQIAPRPGTELAYLPSLYASGAGLFVFNTSTMTFADTLLTEFGDINILTFSDEGDAFYMAAGSELTIYNSETGDAILGKPVTGGVCSVCVPPGTGSIFMFWTELSGFPDPEVHLLELDRETLVTISETSDYYAAMMVYLEKVNRIFLAANQSSTITVADLPGFQPAGEIQVSEYVTGITADPDGNKLYCTVFYNSNPDIDL